MSSVAPQESTLVNNRDAANTSALLNALVGLGLLSAGTGMTVRGIKALRNRVTELPIATIKKPSRFVQKQDRLRKILLNPDYTATGTDDTADVVKGASAKVNQYRTCLEKDSAWQDYLPWNWGKLLDRAAVGVGGELAQKLWEGTSGAAKRTITDDMIGTAPWQYREIKKNAPLKERIIGNLSTHPGFRSLWFLPGATASIGLGYLGGDQLMSKLDDMLGSAKMRSVYKNKAEKIYQQSVKYLQDVAAGKIKTKKEDEDEEQVKEGSFTKGATTGSAPAPKPPVEAVTGNGGSNFLLHPNILLALILAGLTAKQIKGGIRGYDAAKRELADRTHLQRAFQAAQKEREGDYNGLHLELDPEPTLTPQDKSLYRKTNKLVSDTEKNVNPSLRYENYQMERIRNGRNNIW